MSPLERGTSSRFLDLDAMRDAYWNSIRNSIAVQTAAPRPAKNLSGSVGYSGRISPDSRRFAAGASAQGKGAPPQAVPAHVRAFSWRLIRQALLLNSSALQ
jgi:hypothetical protein